MFVNRTVGAPRSHRSMYAKLIDKERTAVVSGVYGEDYSWLYSSHVSLTDSADFLDKEPTDLFEPFTIHKYGILQ